MILERVEAFIHGPTHFSHASIKCLIRHIVDDWMIAFWPKILAFEHRKPAILAKQFIIVPIEPTILHVDIDALAQGFR